MQSSESKMKKSLLIIFFVITSLSSADFYDYSSGGTFGTDAVARAELNLIHAQVGESVPAGEERIVSGRSRINNTTVAITIPADTSDSNLEAIGLTLPVVGESLKQVATVALMVNPSTNYELITVDGTAPVGLYWVSKDGNVYLQKDTTPEVILPETYEITVTQANSGPGWEFTEITLFSGATQLPLTHISGVAAHLVPKINDGVVSGGFLSRIPTGSLPKTIRWTTLGKADTFNLYHFADLNRATQFTITHDPDGAATNVLTANNPAPNENPIPDTYTLTAH